jgi:hypothetical protein
MPPVARFDAAAARRGRLVAGRLDSRTPAPAWDEPMLNGAYPRALDLLP